MHPFLSLCICRGRKSSAGEKRGLSLASAYGALALALILAVTNSCGERTTLEPPALPGEKAHPLARFAKLPPLNYEDPTLWACLGEPRFPCPQFQRVLAITEMEPFLYTPDSTLFPSTPEPWADCFYIYPTVDLRLSPGNHEDLSDHRNADGTIFQQFSPFSRLCRPFAPYYRQALLGTFLFGGEATAQTSLLQAFYDIALAWETYLRVYNQGRPFVLLGHSQGAMLLTMLLHVYFEAGIVPGIDPQALRARLIAAYPIGDHLYTQEGSVTGGSLALLPLCQKPEETKCLIHFRSVPLGYLARESPDNPITQLMNAMALQGLLYQAFSPQRHKLRCASPFAPPSSSPYYFTPSGRRLSPASPLSITPGVLYQPELEVAFDFPAEIRAGDLLLLPHRYFGFCADSAIGELFYIGLTSPLPDPPPDPLKLSTFVPNPLGTHVLDYHLVMVNLLQDVETRAKAWRKENP